MKKKLKAAQDVLQTPSLPLGRFGTGDVARLLNVDIWRVQMFLDGRKYPITPTAHPLGGGRGSRRCFTETDVYRLGIAEHLVKSGFSYKFASNALQQLDEDELVGPYDEHWKEPNVVYVLAGNEDHLTVHRFGFNEAILHIAEALKNPGFYVLNINMVIGEIQKRMRG